MTNTIIENCAKEADEVAKYFSREAKSLCTLGTDEEIKQLSYILEGRALTAQWIAINIRKLKNV